jgi:hypothetical protein
VDKSKCKFQRPKVAELLKHSLPFYNNRLNSLFGAHGTTLVLDTLPLSTPSSFVLEMPNMRIYLWYSEKVQYAIPERHKLAFTECRSSRLRAASGKLLFGVWDAKVGIWPNASFGIPRCPKMPLWASGDFDQECKNCGILDVLSLGVWNLYFQLDYCVKTCGNYCMILTLQY